MKKIMLVLLLMLVLVLGCTPDKPIGGERDEHGCYLMAGYQWCEEKQKCLRTWEEECESLTGG